MADPAPLLAAYRAHAARAAHARAPAEIEAALLKAIGQCGRNALIAAALARVRQLQEEDSRVGAEPGFTRPYAPARGAAKRWQTFDDVLRADAPRAARAPKAPKAAAPKAPLTVSTDAKHCLAALLLAVADLARSLEALPAEPLRPLAEARAREAGFVRLMMRVVAHMRPLLRADPLSRDLGFPEKLRVKFVALAACAVDPGASVVARLFLDFLKAVAWLAAARAYGAEKCFTLNLAALFAIFNEMGAFLPPEEGALPRDLVAFLSEQLRTLPKPAKAAKAAPRPARKAGGAPAAPAAEEEGAEEEGAEEEGAEEEDAEEDAGEEDAEEEDAEEEGSD